MQGKRYGRHQRILELQTIQSSSVKKQNEALFEPPFRILGGHRTTKSTTLIVF